MKLLALAALTVAFTACLACNQPASGEQDAQDAEDTDKAAADLNPEDYAAVTFTTNRGDMVILLDRKHAPLTVENFLTYVEDDHYDQTLFHRVAKDFVIQGGGFDLQNRQKPTRDPIENEWTNGLKNIRGSISMARLGRQPNSATSQFFINVKDNVALDMNRDGAAYAVFGTVIEGMDTVDAVHSAPLPGGARDARPTEDQIIESAEVTDLAGLSDEALAAAAEWQEQVKEWRKAIEKREWAFNNPLEAAKEFVEEKDVDLDSMETTDSGLMIIDEVEGDGEQPASANSTVSVHYTGWLVDGTKFDSSRDRGQPISMPLNQFIAGWAEGVGTMKVGGKRWMIIPGDIAYGADGRPPVIPSNAMLIFEVELLSTQGG